MPRGRTKYPPRSRGYVRGKDLRWDAGLLTLSPESQTGPGSNETGSDKWDARKRAPGRHRPEHQPHSGQVKVNSAVRADGRSTAGPQGCSEPPAVNSRPCGHTQGVPRRTSKLRPCVRWKIKEGQGDRTPARAKVRLLRWPGSPSVLRVNKHLSVTPCVFLQLQG